MLNKALPTGHKALGSAHTNETRKDPENEALRWAWWHRPTASGTGDKEGCEFKACLVRLDRKFKPSPGNLTRLSQNNPES